MADSQLYLLDTNILSDMMRNPSGLAAQQFRETLSRSNTAGITTTSQQVSGLNPNQLYYWRVRSANGTTQGFYSVKFTFTTGTTIGIDEPAIQMTSLYPNPASDFINFSAQLLNSGKTIITLSDKLGRVAYTVTDKITGTSLNHSIPVTGLASGIYLLTIQVDGKMISRKVAVR